jgi:integrase
MGEPALADTRYLEQRRLGWLAVKDVPRALQGTLGRKRMVKSLATRDLTVAQSRRWAALADFERTFATARKQAASDVPTDAGMAWRAALADLERGDPAMVASFGGREETFTGTDGRDFTISPQESALGTARLLLSDQVDAMWEAGDDVGARALADMAAGRVTPLLTYVESWLAEGGRQGRYTERSKLQFRGDLAALQAWCPSAGVPLTIEAFTRKVAGRFVEARLADPKVNRKTLNRKISAASGYWTWMTKRGHVEVNPWERQSVTKEARKAPADRERPFTEAEMIRLLSGPASTEIADAMRVAALTGARIEAIYGLTVGRCADGWFSLPRQKKEPSDRRVPVHPELVAIVARRCEGRKPGDWLFPEGSLKGERAAAISKRFGTYRQRPDVAVHERPDGVRRSLVNFHSFRRWFVTSAEQAGQPPHIISAVVAHVEGRKGMTLGVYSGGPSDDQLRACVEAVVLPSPA